MTVVPNPTAGPIHLSRFSPPRGSTRRAQATRPALKWKKRAPVAEAAE